MTPMLHYVLMLLNRICILMADTVTCDGAGNDGTCRNLRWDVPTDETHDPLIFKMVNNAEALLGKLSESVRDVAERFINQMRQEKDTQMRQKYGLYGEAGPRLMASLLQKPAIANVIQGIEQQRLDGRGPIFMDIGSGLGNTMLSVASMIDWEAVFGLEVRNELHEHATRNIAALVDQGALSEGLMRSIHGDVTAPSSDMVAALKRADVIFMHADGFPSPDRTHPARIPHLSAVLSLTLKGGSVIIDSSKLLVGDRFEYDSVWAMNAYNGEPFCFFVWRVRGEPQESIKGNDVSLEMDRMVHSPRWMKPDVCEVFPKACKECHEASLAAWGFDPWA